MTKKRLKTVKNSHFRPFLGYFWANFDEICEKWPKAHFFLLKVFLE
jgi:hypothetical protein